MNRRAFLGIIPAAAIPATVETPAPTPVATITVPPHPSGCKWVITHIDWETKTVTFGSGE